MRSCWSPVWHSVMTKGDEGGEEGGKEAQERGVKCIMMADSHCCVEETNKAL